MIFSWVQVGAFLAVSAVMGWFLFPSRYIQGQMHKRQGDRSVALKFFSEFLEEHPYHRGATLALIEAYEAAGRPEDAVPAFMDFYEHRRGDADAAYRAVSLLRHCSMYDEADEFLLKFFNDVKDKPDTDRRRLEETLYEAYQRAFAAQNDATTERFLGALAEWGTDAAGYRDELVKFLLSRGRYDKAVALLRSQAARAPRDPELSKLLARVHLARGDTAAALAALTSGLAVLPDDLGLLQDRAELLAKDKRWDEAASDYGRLSALAPREQNWPREMARCRIEGGRFPEGVAILEGMVAKAPGDRGNWMNVIYAYGDRKMFPEAEKWMKSFLAKFPDDKGAWTDLFHLYADRKMHPQAEKLLKDYLARFPDDRAREKDLVDLYLSQHRGEEATSRLESIVKRHPDDLDSVDSLMYRYLEEGRFDDAIDVLKGVTARHPQDFRHQRALGEILSQEDRTEEAVGVYKRLVELQPGEADSWLYLAYLHESRHEYRDAVEVYTRYLERFPKDTKAVDKLASAYLGLGDKAKAIEVLKGYFAGRGALP